MKKKLINSFLFSRPVLVSLLLSLILTSIWYRYGYFYGGGDIGLPLIDPYNSFKITTSSWWEGQGTGFSYPGVLSSSFLYLILSIFQFINVDSIGIQSLFFGSVIFFASLGSYHCYKLFSDSKKIAFWGSVFFLFNPYTLFNVWHRFAHTQILLLAIIPWTVFFLQKYFDHSRYIYLFGFLIVSLFASYSFGTPALLVTWWFTILSLAIYRIIFKTKTYTRVSVLKKLFIIIIFWLALNLWWLYPFFSTAGVTLSAGTTFSGNVESLKAVTNYFKLHYAFRGINSFYLTGQKDFGDFYNVFIIKAISWIGFSLTLLGLSKMKKIDRYVKYFLALFIFSIFFTKGSQLPFGEINLSIFAFIRQMAIFRNPFEKFGILLPFSFAYLFGSAMDQLLDTKKKYIRRSLVVLVVIFVFVYHWPIFTGNIFGSLRYPAFAAVPSEYKEASDWVKKNVDQSSLRILHLPLALGDGTQYAWDERYRGLEIAQAYFPGSNISHLAGSYGLDRNTGSLALAFKKSDTEMIDTLLDKFAINYIVLHSDFDFENYYTEDTYDHIKKILEQNKNIQLIKTFGQLEIYKNVSSPSRISMSSSPTRLSGNNLFFNYYLARSLSETYFTGDSTTTNTAILPNSISNFPKIIISAENALNELPHVNYLPTDKKYPLVRLKEALNYIAKTEREIFELNVQLGGKRLKEAILLHQSSANKESTQQLQEYYEKMNELHESLVQYFNIYLSKSDSVAIDILKSQLTRQKISYQTYLEPSITNELSGKIDSLFSSWEKIGLLMAGNLEASDKNEIIVNYYIPDDGDYIYVSPEHNTEIVELSSGHMSVAYQVNKKNHLNTVTNEVIDLRTNADISNSIEFTISNLDSSYDYYFSYEYFTDHGNSPILFIYQDIDKPDEDGEIIPFVTIYPDGNEYDNGWKISKSTFTPNHFASSATFIIEVSPWNNCADFYGNRSFLCKDKEVYDTFNRESEVQIRNITLQRTPNSGFMLTSTERTEDKITDISYSRENQTRYYINGYIPKGLLIFKDTYHTGWILKSEEGDIIDAEHVVVNGFANGWNLGKEYRNLVIEFEPQNTRNLGFVYGGLLLLFGLVSLKLVK